MEPRLLGKIAVSKAGIGEVKVGLKHIVPGRIKTDTGATGRGSRWPIPSIKKNNYNTLK